MQVMVNHRTESLWKHLMDFPSTVIVVVAVHDICLVQIGAAPAVGAIDHQIVGSLQYQGVSQMVTYALTHLPYTEATTQHCPVTRAISHNEAIPTSSNSDHFDVYQSRCLTRRSQ